MNEADALQNVHQRDAEQPSAPFAEVASKPVSGNGQDQPASSNARLGLIARAASTVVGATPLEERGQQLAAMTRDALGAESV